jgi:hypothetical protein
MLSFIDAGTATQFGPNSVLAAPQIHTQNAVHADPSNPGKFIPERWMIPPGDDQSPSPAVVQAANDVRNCALSPNGVTTAPAGCNVVEFTSPASVELSAPGSICPDGARITVGVNNMNSPLTGTLTVDGNVTPFSTAVGQLSYQTWLPIASNGQTTRQVSVSVTDANGRSSTSSTNLQLVQSCNFFFSTLRRSTSSRARSGSGRSRWTAPG